MKSLSRVRLLATSWTAAYQAPLSMGFSRQECWSGLPLPSPMHEIHSLYTLERPLDCKEIQPVHSEGDQPWDFFGRNDAKSWNSSTLATSWEEMTHWKRLWCWEGLGAEGEGDDRGWDGWMASPTQWTWVWVNSGSWWWTGKPGVLRFMGSKRVGHDWATELNWIFHCICVPQLLYPFICWWTSRLLPWRTASSSCWQSVGLGDGLTQRW